MLSAARNEAARLSYVHANLRLRIKPTRELGMLLLDQPYKLRI